MKNIKIPKFILSASVILSLLFIENSYACGHCCRAYIWNKSPFILGVFLVAVCYGSSIYLIYAITRFVPWMRFVGSFLLFVIVSYFFYFFATEGMLVYFAFVPGMIFCYSIPPWRLYRLAMLKNKTPVNSVKKARKLSFILIPVFIVFSLIFSAVWQKKTDKYFDSNLIEMLNIKSVSVCYIAAEKLLAIEESDERDEYIVELRSLSETGSSPGDDYARKVLAAWGDANSIEVPAE